MQSITELLTDKDDKKAYENTKRIASESKFSDRYYSCLQELSSLLDNKKSYIRTRAFILCCSQAKWDAEGRLEGLLPKLFTLLHDEKPTVVRQCLNAVKEIAVYRSELAGRILEETKTLDFSKYKDSMQPLLQKDLRGLMGVLNETVV